MVYSSAVVGWFAVEFDVALYSFASKEDVASTLSSFSLLLSPHRRCEFRNHIHTLYYSKSRTINVFESYTLISLAAPA